MRGQYYLYKKTPWSSDNSFSYLSTTSRRVTRPVSCKIDLKLAALTKLVIDYSLVESMISYLCYICDSTCLSNKVVSTNNSRRLNYVVYWLRPPFANSDCQGTCNHTAYSTVPFSWPGSHIIWPKTCGLNRENAYNYINSGPVIKVAGVISPFPY